MLKRFLHSDLTCSAQQLCFCNNLPNVPDGRRGLQRAPLRQPRHVSEGPTFWPSEANGQCPIAAESLTSQLYLTFTCKDLGGMPCALPRCLTAVQVFLYVHRSTNCLPSAVEVC